MTVAVDAGVEKREYLFPDNSISFASRLVAISVAEGTTCSSLSHHNLNLSNVPDVMLLSPVLLVELSHSANIALH